MTICACNCGCEPGDWHQELRCACIALSCPCTTPAERVRRELEGHPVFAPFILDAISLVHEEEVEKWVWNNLNPFSRFVDLARKYMLRHMV